MRALQLGEYLINAESFLLFCFVCEYNMKLLKLVKLVDLYTGLFFTAPVLHVPACRPQTLNSRKMRSQSWKSSPCKNFPKKVHFQFSPSLIFLSSAPISRDSSDPEIDLTAHLKGYLKSKNAS